MRSLTPTKWLPSAGLLYLLAPVAGSISLVSETSSWAPLVSLTGRVVPSCPVLVPVGGALVPGAGDAAVLALAVAGVAWLAGAPWVAAAPGLCGGDGEHAAIRRTAAVSPVAAPSGPAMFLPRVRAMWLIGGLRPGVPGWGGGARRAVPPGTARSRPRPLAARAATGRVRVLAVCPRPVLTGRWRVAGRGGWQAAGLGRWPR